jgi:hypothetical protein
MKINGQEPSKNIQAPGNVNKTANPAGQSADSLFLDALKQAAGNLSTPKGTTQQPFATGLGPLASTFIPIMSGVGDQAGPDAVGKLDGLLNNLAIFKNALGNTSIPMERLEPLARELISRKDEITGLLGGIGDEKLKGVASDTLKLVIEQISGYYAGYTA